MKIQQTSIWSYMEMKKSGALNTQEGEVYEAIKQEPTNSRQLAKRLRRIEEKRGGTQDWPSSTVTARVNSIRKKGWIKEKGKFRDPDTDRKVIVWMASDTYIHNPSNIPFERTNQRNLERVS